MNKYSIKHRLHKLLFWICYTILGLVLPYTCCAGWMGFIECMGLIACQIIVSGYFYKEGHRDAIQEYFLNGTK